MTLAGGSRMCIRNRGTRLAESSISGYTSSVIWITLLLHLGYSLDLTNDKETGLQPLPFLRFLKSYDHLACWDDDIQTWKNN